MKAVIFAAGLGTRLRPLTETLPKPLIPVGGKAILNRTLEALPEEIDEIIVVVGHKKEMVIDFLERSCPPKLQRRWVEQPELRGTYDALARAKDSLDGAFLALNGDDIYAKKDLERLLAVGPFSMLAKTTARPNPYSHLETDGGLLRRIVPNASIAANLETTMTYCGAALLDATFFKLEPAKTPAGELSLPHTLEKHLNTNPVQVIEADFWMPVGTPEELAAAETACSL